MVYLNVVGYKEAEMLIDDVALLEVYLNVVGYKATSVVGMKAY